MTLTCQTQLGKERYEDVGEPALFYLSSWFGISLHIVAILLALAELVSLVFDYLKLLPAPNTA